METLGRSHTKSLGTYILGWELDNNSTLTYFRCSGEDKTGKESLFNQGLRKLPLIRGFGSDLR